jgi:hypothetical protein
MFPIFREPETACNQAQKWYPGRLWSLWDMQKFYAEHLFEMCGVFSIWSRHEKEANAVAFADETLKKEQIETIGSFYQPLIDIGFAASGATVKRIIGLLEKEDCKWKELKDPAKECVGRLIDEAHGMEFFALKPQESGYFKNPRKGWELNIERFPEIMGDVEEAAKCLALSRYAAAVFHSLQIIEAALIELGTFLKVEDPRSGWTAVSSALNKVIKKNHHERTRFEKRNFSFLEQVQGTTEGLKNAWRNKISHVHGRLIIMTADFSPDVAEEILFATRSFVRRLAEGLPPAKKMPDAV